MSKFRKLIDAALMLPDQKATMLGLTKMIDEHLLELEIAHPKYYWDFIGELHELVYGEHFDEGMAIWAVSQLKNEDGTMGAHWTETDTSSVAASEGISFDKITRWDWYYVLNMIYSDYYGVIGGDTSMYFKLAKAWVMDSDTADGKAFRYFMAMC